MNSNLVTKATNLKPSKKLILRRQASFAVLGAIVFAIQWRFSLGNIGTSLLVLGLACIFSFAFPKIVKGLQGQFHGSFMKEKGIFQTIGKFVWLIIAASAMSLIWIWLSSITGIPPKILAVITFALAGLVPTGFGTDGSACAANALNRLAGTIPAFFTDEVL